MLLLLTQVVYLVCAPARQNAGKGTGYEDPCSQEEAGAHARAHIQDSTTPQCRKEAQVQKETALWMQSGVLQAARCARTGVAAGDATAEEQEEDRDPSRSGKCTAGRQAFLNSKPFPRSYRPPAIYRAKIEASRALHLLSFPPLVPRLELEAEARKRTKEQQEAAWRRSFAQDNAAPQVCADANEQHLKAVRERESAMNSDQVLILNAPTSRHMSASKHLPLSSRLDP